MPNIYLILSILQFICLPNRSSNKSAPSPIPIPLCPCPRPALLSDIRLGVSIAISRENFQFSTRAVRGREKKEANQNQKTNLPAGTETKVCSLLHSAAAGNVDTRWQLKPEQEPQPRLQTRLRSGQKYGSVLSMAVTMATSQRNAAALAPASCCLPTGTTCSVLLLLLPASVALLLLLPRRGFYLKTILFALWICGA